MRNTIIIFIISLFAVSCGKDKYTSAPQIKFKSVSPDRINSPIILGVTIGPRITINVTDKEGDLGWIDGKDTAFVYIKAIFNNVISSKVDSFRMPDINSIITKNFQADIGINTLDFLRGDTTRTRRPKIDTLRYEIYIKDFAKNKSNVITTSDPLYFVFP